MDQNSNKKRGLAFKAMSQISRGNKNPPLDSCLYWGEPCLEPPIFSHSLSKCWLNHLQVDGHLVKLGVFQKKTDQGDATLFCPDAVGCGEASVFKGFCNKHDTELFRGLDRLDVNASPEICVKLIYRSVCKEFMAKYSVVASFLNNQIVNDPKTHPYCGAEMIRCMELLKYKYKIEDAIQTGDYSDFSHLVFDLKELPWLIGTTTFCPQITAKGKFLIPNFEWLTFTILPKETSGLAILSWNKWAHKNPSLLAQSLLRFPVYLMEMALPRLLLQTSDNVVFSPKKWFGLSEFSKNVLIEMHKDGVVNSEKPFEKEALMPNSKTDYEWALNLAGTKIL
ncbi:MAG: hypothetical protein V4507_02440 [Verrucomicrobiota bacterium]